MVTQGESGDGTADLTRRIMAALRGESNESLDAVIAEAYAPDDWSAKLTRSIASQVRLRRKAKGWSARTLADNCEAEGFPIPRSTIADLESGRRHSISIAELLVLARVLDVPPIDLVFPLETRGQVWITPADMLHSMEARLWWRGGDFDPSLIEQAQKAAAEATEFADAISGLAAQMTVRTPDAETTEQRIARLVYEGVQRAKQELTAQDGDLRGK